jgi:hypothetical protein
MRRSSLALWLSLVGGLLGVQCLDPLSDDCTKTLTCSDQPRVTLSPDCKWRFPDGGIWTGGPRQVGDRWVWPDGTDTATQTYECDPDAGGGSGDGGANGIDCTVTPCDPTLRCNTASKRCVECFSDSHCDEGVCDLAQLHCVPCLSRSDCDGTPCRRDPEDSRNNECVQCEAASSATDCPTGQICDDAAGECTVQCNGSASDQCPEDKRHCDVGRGVCVECNAEADCNGNSGGSQCDPDTKRCVQCVDNTACAAPNGVCDTANNVCVECNSNDECDGANGQCNLDDHKCVACLNDGQCTSATASRCNLADHTCIACNDNVQCEPGAPFCEAGICLQCLSGADCSAVPGANVCDTMRGACVECTLSSQCADINQSRCDIASHTCEPCTGDLDCAGKNAPRDQCQVAVGRCVECEANGDCDSVNASRCNTGLCARCANNDDCSHLTTTPACVGGGGNNARCVQCTTNTDCTSPGLAVCKTVPGNGPAPANTCVECVANGDCTNPSASRCVQNECVPCALNTDCGLPGLGVCDLTGGADGGEPQCVACTGPQRQACGAFVCNSLLRTCTNRPAGGASLCDDCVSDDECAGGRRCAFHTFDTSSGYFCFPVSNPTCGNEAPFSVVSIGSIDNATATACLPRLTTCSAYLDFDVQTCVNDEGCGLENVEDGLCRDAGQPGLLQCTLPCTGAGDCAGGSCAGGACALF